MNLRVHDGFGAHSNSVLGFRKKRSSCHITGPSSTVLIAVIQTTVQGKGGNVDNWAITVCGTEFECNRSAPVSRALR